MVKLVFALRRLPHLTRDQFQRYWLEQHGPLVRSYAEVLGIRRYVQTHTLPDELQAALRASRGAPEPYDGVAELWYDSLEAIATAVITDQGRAAAIALLEDERRFIDHERSPLWFGEKRELIPWTHIFHLAVRDEWEASVEADQPYRRSTIDRSLDEEGFIHCSVAEQVEQTAATYYAGRDDVLLLTIDIDALDAEVKVEGGFPHIYGELPLAAVVDVTPR